MVKNIQLTVSELGENIAAGTRLTFAFYVMQ